MTPASAGDAGTEQHQCGWHRGTPLGFRVNTPLAGHGQHPSTKAGKCTPPAPPGQRLLRYRPLRGEPAPGEAAPEQPAPRKGGGGDVTQGSGTGGGPRNRAACQGGAGRALTNSSPPSAMPRRLPPTRPRPSTGPGCRRRRRLLRTAAAAPAAARRRAGAFRTAWRRPQRPAPAQWRRHAPSVRPHPLSEAPPRRRRPLAVRGAGMGMELGGGRFNDPTREKGCKTANTCVSQDTENPGPGFSTALVTLCQRGPFLN